MKKHCLIGLLLAVGLIGCSREAQVASRNLSHAADNFQIDRRIVFYNGITGDYVLTIEGKCSFEPVGERKVDVTCKTGESEFKKHSLGISDNVTYFSEQLNAKGVSVYQYKVDFRPTTIVPDVDLKVPR
ncbi:hypothetical protein [uncultured Acinetobacter sp.]|uniref:beta-sandwich lipoprotein n=1 Tax=uncultured Acinetobacter sp. TaxID=165433 RepID=UPI0026396291|nr:hypothetical protein [uncultured Acinetobacter sp.]